MDYVHSLHFESLERGESLIDGMSADASVFLRATVRSVDSVGLQIRVDYSVMYKATIDAAGSYHILHTDDAATELSHHQRDG